MDKHNTQALARQMACIRASFDAAGFTEHRELSDHELYKLLYTIWWLTLTDGRDTDDPNEWARTLRMLRYKREAGVA